MPSLLTARSNEASNRSRTFSRVNSFKREWGDDNTDRKIGGKSSSATEPYEWSPSPEPVNRKDTLVSYDTNKASPLDFTAMETPAERRRKAILASIAENSMGSTSSNSTRSSQLQKLPSIPSAQRPHPTQSLPSIPSRVTSSNLRDRKRPLPWEEDMGSAKKAMQRPASAASDRSGKSAGEGSVAGMNIKQKVVLSPEQQKVLSLVVAEGKNIFFTGSAGTGKSVLLREIIKTLRKKYATATDAVAVTASTGIAACNIGGVTLHSFGGVGLAIEKPEALVGKVRKNKKAAARWLRTKVLIIDEVSMVDADLFDKLCKISQMLRKNPNKPWGGIQVIVTGDFFQLPPVTKGGSMPKFCFEAATWDETINVSVNLTKVFRQKDQRFVDMLNEMRFGKMTQDTASAFRKLSRPIVYTDGIEATELFPRREDVERSNQSRLAQLNTDGWSYIALDGGAITDHVQREKILNNFMAAPHLKLKVDAQVMLIKNMDEMLVNGSMGRVIGFCHKQFFENDTQGRWREDAGWEDLAEEDREKKAKWRALQESKLASATPFPVVKFKVPGGGFRDVLIDHDQFKAELPNGEIQASRTQLPLILAWAMSIHKSQGQTLDRVKVDLSKVFEKGQAYVALSRATSLEGLQVLGFSADKVMAHRKVAQWSSSLRDLNV